jgi:TfoX/Sxy family transcriptional regulator of competence genes
MATNPSFVDEISAQARLGAALTSRKMFGEYALYLDGKVVALVCDNQLFVKPTAAGQALLDDPLVAPPFPGAKPHLLVDPVEQADVLSRLLRATAAALPLPKPKAGKGATPARRR